MGILSGLFRSRDKPTDRTAGSSYSFFLGGTASGKYVTERSAMQMTAVYCCVRILSEAVASLPLQFYRYTDDGGKEKAVEHPLYFLLHDEPNPEMTSFIFRETLMTHLLLWGNAYSQIIRNGKGEVVALYPLMPDRMKVDRDEHGRLYYEYTVYDSDDVDGRKGTNKVGRTVRLQPHDVLHIPGLGFDGLVGYSPIAMAKNAIGLAIATEEYGSKFFANGAAPSGVLEDFGAHLRGKRLVHNVLSEGVQADGGYLVPEEFERQIVTGLDEANVVRGLAKVITTSAERKIPVAATHSTAQWTAENGAYTESGPTFDQKTIDAFKLTDLVKVSIELLQDSMFDLESYIAGEFARAFGIAEEEAFCVGTGTGQPTGIFTTNGGTVGVTAASATAITADELINLIYSLKSPYRRNAKFLMNDATVSMIRKLKDKNDAYLWQPSLQAGEPDKLLGYDLYTSPYVPTAKAGALTVAFGDFKNYWIADRSGRTVQRLNELYSTNGQVGFVATERVDGKVILPEGIQLLRMKTSA